MYGENFKKAYTKKTANKTGWGAAGGWGPGSVEVSLAQRSHNRAAGGGKSGGTEGDECTVEKHCSTLLRRLLQDTKRNAYLRQLMRNDFRLLHYCNTITATYCDTLPITTISFRFCKCFANLFCNVCAEFTYLHLLHFGRLILHFYEGKHAKWTARIILHIWQIWQISHSLRAAC